MKTPFLPVFCLVAALGLSSCAMMQSGGSKSSPLCKIRDLDGTAIPEDFTGTLQRTRRTHAANHVVQVNSVQTACCPAFDRVVFDFDGLRLPPVYTIEYVNGPVSQCGSGQTVAVAGNAKLVVTFDLSQAHTEAGQATITNRDRRLNCPNLKHLVEICDFEGKVQFVLGLKSKKPYRAVELVNDSKLVIDIKH